MQLRRPFIRRQRHRIAAAGFAGATLLLCGSQGVFNPKIQFFNASRATTAQCNETNPSIAAIVYTGTPERVREGLRLLDQNKICRLLISGVNTQESLSHFLNHFDTRVTALNRISTDTSQDTDANAINSAIWIGRHPEIKEVVLITSSMHVPRSWILTQRALQSEDIRVDVKALPINDQHFNWHHPFSWHNLNYIRSWSLERSKLTATKFGLVALPWRHAPTMEAQQKPSQRPATLLTKKDNGDEYTLTLN